MNKIFFAVLLETMSKKIFEFNGRSSKKEFLIFTVFEISIFTFLYVYLKNVNANPSIFDFLILILSLCLIVIHFLASISLTIRRLHDCNLKGWWYLLSLIFSPVIFLMFCFIKGDKNKNKYGEPPSE